MRFYPHIADLPATLPVFPLTGALLLPRGVLPVNVFEPRYLALVDAAMSGARLIGMIQPTIHEDKALKPPLSAVGCAGRITSYQENDDGRYVIALTGICRFKVAGELDIQTPFRQVTPDYAPFAGDLAEGTIARDFPRERLAMALKAYLSNRELKADWQSVMGAPAESLVNALAMLCPFEPAEKQALLEAQCLNDRVDTLVALLEMARVPSSGRQLN
jgi:Lon protease-like protein